MGIVETITVILIVMKLALVGVVASWSWWQVFTPELIVLAFYAVVVAFLTYAAHRAINARA